jgi:hypothetical protein
MRLQRIGEIYKIMTYDCLYPFFTFFGGKWRSYLKYPPPIYDNLFEPFAGSAGYSLRYYNKKVMLVDNRS